MDGTDTRMVHVKHGFHLAVYKKTSNLSFLYIFQKYCLVMLVSVLSYTYTYSFNFIKGYKKNKNYIYTIF